MELLTRDQLKEVYGGTSSATCRVGIACSLFVSDGGKSGTTYNGECDAGWGGGSGGYMECGCSTDYGPYVIGSNGGVSYCVNPA